MLFNKDKFILEMYHKKLSYGKLANDLGMCRTTLWNKINGHTDFKSAEISKMKKIFGNDIFLD